MSGKSRNDKIFYMGDPAFNQKLMVYYSWVAPVVLFVLSCCLFIDRVFLTGLILLLLVLFLLPINNRYTARLAKPLRIFIVIGLIILSYYSMYLYQYP